LQHCQASIPPEPTHQGTCPYCKETINPAAVRCQHCKSNLNPGGIVGRLGLPKRRLRRAGAPIDGSAGVDAAANARECPDSVIMRDPSGSGLGVWQLIIEDDEWCYYEYAGGIV
jgi:hypothetical protein